MISMLLSLQAILVKSENICDLYEYQNCQGECIDLQGIKPNISIPWLCGDQCQTFSKPCNGKCPYGLYLTCNRTCALQSLATTDDSWNCKDDCQPTSEPCSGKCLTPFHNCKNECIDLQLPCGIKCPKEKYLDCSGKCLDEWTADLQGQEMCNGVCQSLTKPCLGQCVDNLHYCDGKCLALEEPCNNTCKIGYFLGCSGKCENSNIASEQSKWMCNSTCQSITKPCNGQCSSGKYLCGEECIVQTKPCANTCAEGMNLDCNGNCAWVFSDAGRWLCGDICQSIDNPCNGSCPSLYNFPDGLICRGSNICFTFRHMWRCPLEYRSFNAIHDSSSLPDIYYSERFVSGYFDFPFQVLSEFHKTASK